MNTSDAGPSEAGMAAEKIPEANPLVLQRIDAMIEDPIAYLQREREASLREARVYVDDQVSKKLAEQRQRRLSFGQRILQMLGHGQADARPASS